MKKLTLILGLLLFAGLANSQSTAIKTDQLLKAYHDNDQFTGSVMLVKNGEVVYKGHYGYADRDKRKLNNAGTEYRIGSISKPMTSHIILKLVDQKKIDLQDKMAKYLPGLSKYDSVTIEHLLQHQSGIKSITSTKVYNTDRKSIIGKNEVIEILSNEEKQFSPGTQWQYSNSNYMLLSYIAEKVSGKSMEQLIKEMATSMGMRHTGMDHDGRQSNNKAMGYEAVLFDDYVTIEDNNIQLTSGAGSVYSTLDDLYQFHQSLQSNPGISDALMQKMYTPGKKGYGYGWEVGEYKGEKEVGHSGSIEGFKSMIMRYPGTNSCIIFLSNYWNTPGQEICDKLRNILFDEAFTMPSKLTYVEPGSGKLKSYEGAYRFNDAITMHIEANEKGLISAIEGQPPVAFRAVGDNAFWNRSHQSTMQFDLDETGKVKGFILKKGKRQMEWKKQ